MATFRFFLFIFFSLGIAVCAQDTKIDSLRKELDKEQNDLKKSALLNQLADLYKSENPLYTKEFSEKALAISKKNKQTGEEGKAYINLGNYSIITGDYPRALQYFQLAKDLFEQDDSGKYSTELARVYGSIGIVFSEQNSYARALEYNLKALKIYENRDDQQTLSRIYNNTGIVYKALKENNQAFNYFKKAEKLQKSLNDPTIGITMTNIGNIYLEQKDYPNAFEYYQKAENRFRENPNPRGSGELYNSLGLYYQETGKTTEAVDSWNRAIGEFSRIEDKFGISDTHYFLGRFYLSRKEFKSAAHHTREANALAKELGLLEMLTLSEKQLRDIYEASGNYNLALHHAKEYDTYKDSLINYREIRKSVQSEMDFEFEKKEALHKEQQQKQEALFIEKSKRHRQQFIFGTISVMLCLGLAFLFYNRNQIKKSLTLQKSLAEYEHKALHLQMNPHFVFNCLGSISSFIVQNGNDSAIKYLTKFSKLMRLTLEYSKEPLIAVDKEIEGLQNYLELEQLRFNKVFNFTITKSECIEDDMALPPLFIQPFVENSIIHGIIPKKIQGFIIIDFSVNQSHLICTITDDGIGIETSKKLKTQSVSVHKSMAMDIIEKRLKMIESSTSKTATLETQELKDCHGNILGTKVTLKLPVQYIKNELKN